MKYTFHFSNLLGTVYQKGNLIFSSDGTTVISPVGNRITLYDLKNNKSLTLPVESRYNYSSMALSPNGYILIAVNEEGEAHFISMISKMVIQKYRFKGRISSIHFSPDGNYFAVCKAVNVYIFSAPGLQSREYNPLVMERVFTEAKDDTSCIQWSFDSKLLAVGSKDSSIRLYSLKKWINVNSCTFPGHSNEIVGCYFEKDNYDLATMSREGYLCIWECSVEPDDFVVIETPSKKSKLTDIIRGEEEDLHLEKGLDSTRRNEEATELSLTKPDVSDMKTDISKTGNRKKLQYRRLGRHYLADHITKDERKFTLAAAAYHSQNRILVVGFNIGAFFLYELPSVNVIHSLSIVNQHITAISINCTGDWIALGFKEVGQLLVWEWQSETYILKQQGHSSNMTCLCYNPNGQYIGTGGLDGKIKLWNSVNGFCIVTFHEHVSSVSEVLFSRNQMFFVSASLDGTVRAYDLTRYRNFKTFTSPKPVQFSCVALDASDEILAAGGQDVFEIYLWSIKLGSLLEILSGHEGPVASIAFSPNPTSTALASASWDKTLKLWNAIESSSIHETIQLNADALSIVYRPDGEEIAVATLDGQISFFDCKSSMQAGNIEGRTDLGSGRSDTDLINAKRSKEGKAFTSLSYSTDGTYIVAGGQSKNVCIYNIQESLLLKKFEITQNRSLYAVNDFSNRRKVTELGNLNLVEERKENEGGNVLMRLPGARRGDMASRSMESEIRVFSLQFSPTGQAWAAATTEGLLIYTLDTVSLFDPFHLNTGITPEAIRNALRIKNYSKALVMALKLNEVLQIRYVVESIPYLNISLTLAGLSNIYVEKVMKFAAAELEITKHLQFYLLWIETILTEQAVGMTLVPLLSILLILHKNIRRRYDDLSKMCDFNQYTMNYLKRIRKWKLVEQVMTIEEMALGNHQMLLEEIDAN